MSVGAKSSKPRPLWPGHLCYVKACNLHGLRRDYATRSRMHSIDKAALYEDSRYDRSVPHSLGSLGGAVTVSREAFELLRLKDRAMDNTKEGITIADCRQAQTTILQRALVLSYTSCFTDGSRFSCVSQHLWVIQVCCCAWPPNWGRTCAFCDEEASF